MAVSAIGTASTTGTGGTSGTGTDKTTLIGNYEAFLQLLTAQLKSQSPLEPLDANQFTQQLVQFSTVEQAIRSNDRLDQLINLQVSNQATALIGLIGAKITAEGSTTTLSGGKAAWNYNAGAAGTATVTIRNADGSLVYSEKIDVAKGDGTFEWNGKTSDGKTAPDGSYSITIDAKDGDGNQIDVSTVISGTVDGIDFTGTVPALKIGKISVPVTALRSVTHSS